MIIYTGRFQPFHNGHISIIRYLSSNYPDQLICLAIIKDVPIKNVTEFDKTVNSVLSKERNPFNAEITLNLIRQTLKAENINNVVVTLMPRASKETWDYISAVFDCDRIWVFTQNQASTDTWEEKKCGFYQSMGEKVIRVPIQKDINGSEIRRAIQDGNLESIKIFIPQTVYEYFKNILL